MICVQIVKKLFLKPSNFERVWDSLLHFYTSSALQRNGNNHSIVALPIYLQLLQGYASDFFCNFMLPKINGKNVLKTLYSPAPIPSMSRCAG